MTLFGPLSDFYPTKKTPKIFRGCSVNNGHPRDRLECPLCTDDCYTQVDYNVEIISGPTKRGCYRQVINNLSKSGAILVFDTFPIMNLYVLEQYL